MADKEAAARSGVSPTWLSCARSGLREGAKAEGNWQRLARALDAGLPPVPGPPQKPRQTAPGALQSLADQARHCRTVEDIDAFMASVQEGLADGSIPPNLANSLTQVAKERRQLLEDVEEAKRRADSGKPIEVVVRHESDWVERLDPAKCCPTCKGTGLRVGD